MLLPLGLGIIQWDRKIVLIKETGKGKRKKEGASL